MNTLADKTQENKNESIASDTSQKQGSDKATFQFVDNRPEVVAQRKMQEMANNSQQVSQLKVFQDMANNSPQTKQVAQLQPMATESASEQQQPTPKKENNTGLPDNLKTGMESEYHISLNKVKVHYNSDEPAQLQAHAFAKGDHIHLGPGQEKHLPHELGHVVQQMQGRVKPTMQMNGNVNVNDDSGLEKEADVMGAKALLFNQNGGMQNIQLKENHVSQVIQRKVIKYNIVGRDDELTVDTGDFKPSGMYPDLYSWLMGMNVPFDISSKYISGKAIEADKESRKAPVAKGSKEMEKGGNNATAIKMFDTYLKLCGVERKKFFPPEYQGDDLWTFYWKETTVGALMSPSKLGRKAKAKLFKKPPSGLKEKLKKLEKNKKLAEKAKKDLVIDLLDKVIPNIKYLLNTLDVDSFLEEYFELDENGYSNGLSKKSYLAKIPGDPLGIAAFEKEKLFETKEKTGYKTYIQKIGPILAKGTTEALNPELLDVNPKLRKALEFQF